VVIDFRLDRGRDGPRRFLGQFEGILQTDGYAAYDQIGGPRMVHAACRAHAGRQFFEAVKLNPRDPVAIRLWRGWTNCLPSLQKLAAKR
jgi:transposase